MKKYLTAAMLAFAVPAQAADMSTLNGVMVALAYDSKCKKVLTEDALEVLGQMAMMYTKAEIAFTIGRVGSYRNKPQFCSEMASTVDGIVDELNANASAILQR